MEKYLINPGQKLSTISEDIYGHFSEHLGRCIYDGLYVGEDSPIPNVNGMRTDLVEALRDMGIPVLRWPGGCFADLYHWRDGIGPKESRKKTINAHWGGVVEDNSFGTHEFFELCRQLGCDAYVAGNLGSGTVQEMSEWAEYITAPGGSTVAESRKANGQETPWKMKYFGVGNENWGCGGDMTAEFYSDQYKRYACFLRGYDRTTRLNRIACGPSGGDYHWTEVMMKNARRQMDGLALHYYTVTNDWAKKGKALEFSDEEYLRTLSRAYAIEELISRHSGIMDRYDPEKRVALVVDEWGVWHDVEEGTNPGFLYQQNAMRDAMVAGMSLNIFNKHSDRVRMANIAQTVNVLQSVALTDGEDMILTPTYFVFRLYKDHQENTLLGSHITTPKIGKEEGGFPQLTESASLAPDGSIVATVVNASPVESAEILTCVADFEISDIKAEILAGEAHDHNSFEDKTAVGTRAFEDFENQANGFATVLPPCSVVKFVIR